MLTGMTLYPPNVPNNLFIAQSAFVLCFQSSMVQMVTVALLVHCIGLRVTLHVGPDCGVVSDDGKGVQV